MTKKAFLEAALKAGGLTKSIYTSLKQLKHAAGTQYGAVLRISDTPVRATSKKTFKDQQGASLIRRKADVERQEAILEYIALAADVELPDDSESEGMSYEQ